MNNFMNYELAVTYECNWNCPYCLVDTHLRNPKNIKDVLEEIESFKPNSSVTLSGGEPGMLSEKDLSIIIKKLKSKNIIIDLLTNGLFLKRHKKFLKYIDEILYHSIEKVSDRKDIEIYDSKNIIYVMVITNKDLEKMDDILYYFDKYNIKFLISPNIKPQERINISKFLKLINDYPQFIHKRTKDEFIKNISK